MGRKRSVRRARLRRARATESMEHLEAILSGNSSTKVKDVAARDMIRLSKRHRLGLPNGRRTWICRDCNKSLIPGKSCTVRVRNTVLLVTCDECGRVNRRPSGGLRR